MVSELNVYGHVKVKCLSIFIVACIFTYEIISVCVLRCHNEEKAGAVCEVLLPSSGGRWRDSVIQASVALNKPFVL